MRPTASILGASRLPLTSKRGNKDYYKGTRQAYVPGGGHRTGPPGQYVVHGKAKYRVSDTQVRVFVGPGIEKIEETTLKPYVTTKTVAMAKAPLPSFSPMVPRPAKGEVGSRRDPRIFSRIYNNLPLVQKQALIMQSRREWWTALAQRFPAPERHAAVAEEAKTLEVEGRADKAEA